MDLSGQARDGAVDAVDIQLIFARDFAPPVDWNCDANNDGTVSAVDIQLVIKAVGSI